MKILLIDGEYLKKNGSANKNLGIFLIEQFGKLFYPDEIIYYTAKMDESEKEILEKSIKNLKINDRGYIQNDKSNNTSHQKAVDGYIIADLTEISLTCKNLSRLYLLAGDGDLKAGVEKVMEHLNLTVELIAFDGTISPCLKDLCHVNLITLEDGNYEIISEGIKKEEVVEEPNVDKYKGSKFKKEMIALVKIFKNENSQELLSSVIGQRAKEFNLKYRKGKLNQLLETLAENSLITLKKSKNQKDYIVSLAK